jgi:hypothetical protein
MSKTAEDVSASLSEQSSTLEPTDQIAELLLGGAESVTEEESDDENLTATSNQDEDEASGEDEEANDGEEETTLEAVADDEPTWENVLGVSEASLSFDEAGNVAGFKTKVNGEDQVIPAADLIAGYQNNKSNTSKSQAHSEAVKEFEVQKGKAEEVYSSKLASVEALTKHFETQLIGDYNNIDWNKLRVEDPAEYAAARHDYATKAGELTRIMEAISTDKQSQNQEANEVAIKKKQEYMKSQYDIMIEKNPTWSDEAVRKVAQEEHKAFVQEQYGVNDQEWGTVSDSRMIELIKDAKKYHDGAKVAEKKTLKPVPKFQKGRGRGQKAPVSKLAKLTSAASKAKGSAKRDLQTSAVAELLLGGHNG